MGTKQTPIGKDEKQRLGQFLKRRQLKEQIVGLLEEIRKEHDLKRGQVTTAKNATYEELVEALANALNSGWLTVDKVAAVLDEAELSGRQHVCLFVVDEGDLNTVKTSLLSPKTHNKDKVQFEEFWDIPLEPYTRVLSDTAASVLSKTITARKYWVEIDRVTKEDYIKVERKREKERAALVIKLDLQSRLLQFRVPIKEQAPGVDTSKSVYEFITEMVESQYGKSGLVWLSRLKPLKIGDAFQNIVKNRDDFELHTDHPENKHIKSVMSRKGSPDTATDIRDFDQWVFESGFARSCIRGMWKRDEDDRIDVRMHYEQVKVNKTLNRNIARLYFAKPYTDEEVEHVIKRIREHF
jgi:hypothetical protein